MVKKLLFKATLREINFLIENNYLNDKGLEWAKSLLHDLEDDILEKLNYGLIKNE